MKYSDGRLAQIPCGIMRGKHSVRYLSRTEPVLVRGSDAGFAAIFIAILILVVILAIGLSVATLVFTIQRVSGNVTRSNQAYFTAEAGIEDALLRLAKAKKWSSPYTFNISNSSATVEISNIIGGSRTVTAQGNFSNRIRKVQAVYQISTQRVSFYYGAQVGDGGMEMGNGSVVQGNVFSNGTVIGGGTITNNITVAGNDNEVQGINVGGDAVVHTCDNNAHITGTLYYVTGGSYVNCTYGAAVDRGPNEIEDIPLSIPQSQVDEWKTAAAAGGIIDNDVFLSGPSNFLGPKQIGTPAAPKNLTLANNTTLKVTGTIYVTGNITFNNGDIIELDNASYGSFSGVIISDGKINVDNGVILNGTGMPGSYIMILSTNNSLDPANPAIFVKNTAIGAIFYATSGLIYLRQNMIAREITGYKVNIENNAIIQYESGLQDATFTSGTGGSWEVASWKEVE